jgi:hypothetical protein
MKTRRIVSWSAAALVAGLTIWFVRTKVHMADPTPAIAFADNYFSELKAGNAAGTLIMYEPIIATGPADALPRLLLTMQSSHGNVVSAELQTATVAPKDDVACYWLTYNVTRASAKSVENFLTCPQSGGRAFGIAGHALLNPATGQHISFGTTLQTKAISLGNAP